MTETDLPVIAARWRERIEIERQLRGLRLGRLVNVAPAGRFTPRLDWRGSWADLQGVPVEVLGAGSKTCNGTWDTWPGKVLKASKCESNGSIGLEAG